MKKIIIEPFNDVWYGNCYMHAILPILRYYGVSLCLYFLRGEGNTVNVLVNGEEVATYSLDENRVEDIRTGKDGLNRLIIKDGKAWIEKASCPDGICAAHKPIHREGESIVCLPNKVVITVNTAEGHSNSSDHADEPSVDIVIR